MRRIYRSKKLLTLKIVMSSKTLIVKCGSVFIARPGQIHFEVAIAKAANNGCTRPEIMLLNNGGTEIIHNDSISITPRYIVDDEPIIGLVCVSEGSHSSYIFIYNSESAHVINDNGSTIETLR